MYESSPYEDSRGLRLSADQDFMRSLDQLENLLEDDLMAATAEHLITKEVAQTNNPEQTNPELSNRFGGSILDAIPLAERLGARLNTTKPASVPDDQNDETPAMD